MILNHLVLLFTRSDLITHLRRHGWDYRKEILDSVAMIFLHSGAILGGY